MPSWIGYAGRRQKLLVDVQEVGNLLPFPSGTNRSKSWTPANKRLKSPTGSCKEGVCFPSRTIRAIQGFHPYVGSVHWTKSDKKRRWSGLARLDPTQFEPAQIDPTRFDSNWSSRTGPMNPMNCTGSTQLFSPPKVEIQLFEGIIPVNGFEDVKKFSSTTTLVASIR